MLPVMTLLAMLVELSFGFPERLYARIGHPVTWIGRLIAFLDHRLNRDHDRYFARRRAGLLALALITATAMSGGAVLQTLALAAPFGFLAAAVFASGLLAQRSLAAHVRTVADALEAEGLASGRRAVAQIVGRDLDCLDEAGICRAAIESLAENFSDGVTAPVFWLAVAGLPGGLAYKAINTADSMIGHRTARHEAFGWAAARLDDLVNLPASRLSGLLLVAAACLAPGASPRGAWRAMRRDASSHRSPNAGWPEASMAGALGISIAGPRYYNGVLVGDAEMNRGARRILVPADIYRALRLFWVADALLIALLAAISLFSYFR